LIGEILAVNDCEGWNRRWGAEFAKLCNKPLYVFDQARDAWFRWNEKGWVVCGKKEEPVITTFTLQGWGRVFSKRMARKPLRIVRQNILIRGAGAFKMIRGSSIPAVSE